MIDKKSLIKLQSPQMKFLTDNIEDTKVCSNYLNSNHLASCKFDYTKEEHIIAEDNNENNLECCFDMRKSVSNKKIESFIDRSENFEDYLNMKKSLTESIIEPIKEENIEEEEMISTSNFHQNNKNCEFLLSDELGPHNKTNRKYRFSLVTSNSEDKNKIINELDDEF